jgi:hypothetical protein
MQPDMIYIAAFVIIIILVFIFLKNFIKNKKSKKQSPAREVQESSLGGAPGYTTWDGPAAGDPPAGWHPTWRPAGAKDVKSYYFL